MQSKSPYIGTITQFDGLEDIWRDANNSSRPYLPYNPDDKAPGRPSREQPPVSSSGIMAEISLAAEDIKRTTGIYDAALGARSNETSGIAINARKMESQNSTSIYADNMVKAITHAGRVIVDMIPRIYDTQRVIRIIGGDDAENRSSSTRSCRAWTATKFPTICLPADTRCGCLLARPFHAARGSVRRNDGVPACCSAGRAGYGRSGRRGARMA